MDALKSCDNIIEVILSSAKKFQKKIEVIFMISFWSDAIGLSFAWAFGWGLVLTCYVLDWKIEWMQSIKNNLSLFSHPFHFHFLIPNAFLPHHHIYFKLYGILCIHKWFLPQHFRLDSFCF